MASRKLSLGRKAATKGAKARAGLKLAERVVTTPRRPALPKTKLMAAGAVAGTAGAVGIYLFDPEQGNRRRSVARDRAMKLLRRGGREAAQKADYAAGQAKGAVHEARQEALGEKPKPELTDQALARKVESVIFRDADVPKGKIDVDAVGATVSLRGEADTQERIDELVREANEIPEVHHVENLLHLPDQPAPTRTDTPESQRA
ncbi:MAG TPA: BON domain-containing protein [Thermoleophilaceae bacterium]|nr:BON domain-containing protein [Thermoleophilaceae bacterium]